MIASCDRVIDAPLDVVWGLVSTVSGLKQWMCVEASVDLVVGGAIRWVHDNGWVVAGEFREIVPMRRLVFSYGWEHGGFPVPLGSSVVTIEIAAMGGVTKLSVRHDGLTDEMAEQHTGGWEMVVRALAETASVARLKGPE